MNKIKSLAYSILILASIFIARGVFAQTLSNTTVGSIVAGSIGTVVDATLNALLNTQSGGGGPQLNSSGGNLSQGISGVTISFPGTNSVMDTSATIPVLVSVKTQQNVNLSTYIALVGAVFSGNQPLLSQMISPNSPAKATISFSGLTAGKTYSFVIENNIKGTYSNPIQFTTTGGTPPVTPTSPSTPAVTVPVITPPSGAPATGLVPQCGRTIGAGSQVSQMCTFNDFMALVANVIKYGIVVFFMGFTVMLIYAGFMLIYLGSKGDPTSAIEAARKKYGSMIMRAVIGLIIIMCAWVIISTILIALGVQHQYILLDIFSGH